MKEVVLVVSGNGAGLASDDMTMGEVFVRFDLESTATEVAQLAKDGLKINFRGKRLVLAASFKRTLIRVVDASRFGHKRRFFQRGLKNSDAWEVINSVFPIGSTINEDTHLFDISFFGDTKYVCYGFPACLSEKLAEIGKELTGSVSRVSRLETVENLMFARQIRESKILIFPQDDGFRLLAIKNGLPENVFFISNHPERREAEFELILDSIGQRMAICTSSFMPPRADNGLEWIEKYK